MTCDEKKESTSATTSAKPKRMIVVGGGLAGLSAAAALMKAGLVQMGHEVIVLEARRRVGGRAASFEDPLTGGLVDACQHVAMGCCTNFLDLCKEAGVAGSLRRDRTLYFIGHDGIPAACTPSVWLPAPLHLGPLLLGMRHFTFREKTALALGLLRLARYNRKKRGTHVQKDSGIQDETAQTWLEFIGQPERVIRLFWQPVLESALGESIDLVSVVAARKVVVDGFLAHRNASDLYVPTQPLGRLFGEHLVEWLKNCGVTVETGRSVTAIQLDATGRVSAVRCGTEEILCDSLIVALPWKQAARLLPDIVPVGNEHLTGSPITAVHLWFDRDVMNLPHAVLVGRVSQWVFRGDDSQKNVPGYCQVVISASRGLQGDDRDVLLATVISELKAIFPAAREAQLLNARIVTDPTAVLSVRPGVEAVRPAAVTHVPNLFLAGDWTATGWPSTMEGAVRSGRLAAQAAGGSLIVSQQWQTPDLPKNWLVRRIIGTR